MDEQNLQSIKQHLQNLEVQERIRQNMLLCRSQITASIGEVVKLLNLSQNQLRKWEARGLLQPQKIGSHRHYSLQDLEKLVIIHELINSKYPPRTIPLDIDSIWQSISLQNIVRSQEESQDSALKAINSEIMHQSINQRIEHVRKDLFWRYYVSSVIRLALALICENLPQYSNVGLILPLHTDITTISSIYNLEDLPKIGESLVGWLAQSGSFHTLLTSKPSFDYTKEYSIYRLQETKSGMSEKDFLENKTLIIIDGGLHFPALDKVTIAVIQRILAPIYEDVQLSRICFGPGVRDVSNIYTDLNNHHVDSILTGLADMVVRLGMINNRKRWQFCCILLPDDTTLPLQQRSLIVRAQSEDAPHKIGDTDVLPNEPIVSVSLRAYQSGQIIYRSEVYEEDTTIAYQDLENPGSVIAVPIGGENTVPTAVLYVVSNTAHAFTIDDQRVLRLISKMVEEAILTYHIRKQTTIKTFNAIIDPEVADTFFAGETENGFVKNIENLLSDIQMKENYEEEIYEDAESGMKQENLLQSEQSIDDGLSLIAIDIDRQSQLANTYGDQFTRNLVKVVSSRLKPELLRIFADSSKYNFYYICADRFYLVTRHLTIDEASKNADRIRRRINGLFEVSILYPLNQEKKFIGSDESALVPISVHIGVCYYKYKKLEDLLKRYPAFNAVGRVRALINRDIEMSLDKGRIEKGDVVMVWNPELHKFVRSSP